MNFKYTLVVKNKKHVESYYGQNADELIDYAKFRKFAEYKIYELKEVGSSGHPGKLQKTQKRK